MEKSIFEQMCGTYHQKGDYPLLNLVPPESVSMGVWGQRRRRFLREQRRPLYTAMMLEGTLDGHLAEIDQQAEEMFSRLMREMAEREGVTEELKATDQMTWVGLMNNIQNRATEVVNTELIYS